MESKEITIEIEASRGGTLMAFSFIAKGDEIFIQKTENCDLADIDNDYIFECSENLYRIQAEIDY